MVKYQPVKGPAFVYHIAFSSTGNALTVACWDNTAYVYPLAQARARQLWRRLAASVLNFPFDGWSHTNRILLEEPIKARQDVPTIACLHRILYEPGHDATLVAGAHTQ
eukprot:6701617-Prymnesium_polylepis.3